MYNSRMFPDTVFPDTYFEPATAWIDPVCRTCKFWRAEPDGSVGECRGEVFCQLVWSKYSPLDPIMTKSEFHCDYWEQNDK